MMTGQSFHLHHGIYESNVQQLRLIVLGSDSLGGEFVGGLRLMGIDAMQFWSAMAANFLAGSAVPDWIRAAMAEYHELIKQKGDR